MLNVSLDYDSGIARLEPHGALAASDFEAATDIVDRYLADHKKLAGVIILTEHFPGWDSFRALLSHLTFVRDHHEHIRRVAIVTDSAIVDLVEPIARHFVAAEIRHFHYPDLDHAIAWITG